MFQKSCFGFQTKYYIFVTNKAINMQKLISDNLKTIKSLCASHNVNRLYVFGSACTDKFNEKSDIDLLISFMAMDAGDYADTYLELAEEFEKLFNRSVDLVTEKSLSNPYFIESINKSKTLLYGN